MSFCVLHERSRHFLRYKVLERVSPWLKWLSSSTKKLESVDAAAYLRPPAFVLLAGICSHGGGGLLDELEDEDMRMNCMKSFLFHVFRTFFYPFSAAGSMHRNAVMEYLP